MTNSRPRIFRRLFVLPAIAVALLLNASSCDNSLQGEGGPPLPTNLKIVGALPAFPTLEEPDYVVFDVDYPVSLRLDLNQTAQPVDLVFSFCPSPADGWSKRASTTSPVFWIDGFAPDSSTVLQTILIDGPRFLHPWLWEFWVRPPTLPSGMIDANVFQKNPNGPSPEYALMLFYEESTVQDVTSAPELFSRPATRAAFPDVNLSDTSGPHFQRVVDGLIPHARYTMAVIVDTDGDGVYDPRSDWWGTAHLGSGGNWLPWFTPAGTDPFADPFGRLDAELLPPPVR